MKRALLALCISVLFAAPLTTVRAADMRGGDIRVFVSILPQAYFVERIGGSHVDVEVLVGPGQSPATYEPTPKQMSRLGESQVYFLIGVPFEKAFLPKISSLIKNLRIVDTRAGVSMRYFSQADGMQVPDPHIWLDPKRVKIQARSIEQELSRLDPDHAGDFSRNLRTFEQDLDDLDRNIACILAPFKGGKIFVFHPAFGYFTESYGLEQTAVEVEGKEPSPRQLSGLIDRARAEQVRIIFVQPQFSRRNAQTIAREIGGAVVPINPLPEDYLKDLETMAEEIGDALSRR